MSLTGMRVAVVVPARDEAAWIAEVVETLPAWVDRIVVVDDASTDDTSRIALGTGDPRLMVIRHSQARGVGGAIVSGYRRAHADGCDVVAVMAGDGQMDPTDLATVVRPVATGEADYVKGNRLRHPAARDMPRVRAFGSAALGVLTSAATGVSLGDSQCGFTAISRHMLSTIALEALWQGYGYPNDLLGAVVNAGGIIREVPVRPVYRGEASGLRPRHAAVIALLVGRVWLRRLAGVSPASRGAHGLSGAR